jgi:hypothetical protein
MENLEEKKQNNRKQDERRSQDTKDKTTPSAKEWDPNRESEADALSTDEKLERSKDVRKPDNSGNA